MSEVIPGVHRLVAPLGDRYVCLFLVVGTDSAAVIELRHAHEIDPEAEFCHWHLEDIVARGLARVLPGRPSTFATVRLQ
jgi:hypothetical protein